MLKGCMSSKRHMLAILEITISIESNYAAGSADNPRATRVPGLDYEVSTLYRRARFIT